MKKNQRMISFKLIFLAGCFAAIILSTTADADNSSPIDNKQPKLHVFEGVIRYNLRTSDLDYDHLERCTESPEFELHYVTWKIEACKEHTFTNFGEKLTVTLVSVFKEKTEAWSCEAEATFKVIPIEPHNAVYVRFGYFNYDSVSSSPNRKDLILWNKLLAKHTINGIATIDVTIKVKPPNRIAGIQHTATKFQMRLLEVNKLDYLYSEEAIVRGIRWKVLALKRNEHFGVAVFANEDDIDLDYTWNVSATFHLVSLDPSKTMTRAFSGIQFDWTTTNYGFNKFLKWTDVVDPNKKFVIGDSALLQIELNVAKPKSKVNL